MLVMLANLYKEIMEDFDQCRDLKIEFDRLGMWRPEM